MGEAEEVKLCNKCGDPKPIGEFPRDRTHKDGRASSCRLCRRSANKEWRLANPDKVKSGMVNWLAKNRDKWREMRQVDLEIKKRKATEPVGTSGPTPENRQHDAAPEFVDQRIKKGDSMYESPERKAYRAKHARDSRQKDKAAWATEMREWRLKHHKRWRELYSRHGYKTSAIMRQALLAFFGGRCVRCTFSDWRALQLDHINGGGYKDNPKGTRRSSYTLYALIRLTETKPDMMKAKYQLLCANCNWIKRYENREMGRQVNKFNDDVEAD